MRRHGLTPHRGMALLGTLLVAGLPLGSCGEAPASNEGARQPPGPPRSVIADDVLVWLDPLELEEHVDAVFVSPRIADWEGGYVVTDWQELTVMVFDRDGRFLRSFGGAGQGPHEFGGADRPRVLGDRMAHADRAKGRVTVWNLQTGELEAEMQVNRQVSSVAWLGPGRLIFSLRWRREFDELLYEIEVPSGDTIGAAFNPVIPTDQAMGNQMLGMTSLEPGANGIAMVFAPRDTLFLFRRGDISAVTAVPLHRGMDPIVGTDFGQIGPWIESNSWASDLYAYPGGGWLVITAGQTPERVAQGLYHMDSEGRPVWEVPFGEIPMLIGVGGDGTLYFAPDELTPQLIRRALLR